jgi:CheY-like chemotaxis protein
MRTILVADMSPASRVWLRRSLELGPTRVREVANAWDLFEALADREPVDLIVLPKWLPELSGLQALAALRTAGIHTPAVVVLPFCRDRQRSLCRRLGRAEVVEDPFDVNQLQRAAYRLLADEPPAVGADARRALMQLVSANAVG